VRQPVLLDGESLTLTEVERVARHDEPVQIAERAKGKMQESRAIVERIAADRAQRVYGVNTGFGSLKDVAIANADLARLQHNLLMSHSAGVGDPLPTDTVRTAMVLRANALAKGFSGVRLEVVQTLVEMINCRVHPFIPTQGSVGASGDLAPLSHLALVLSRPPADEDDRDELSGEVITHKGLRISGKVAMEREGIARLVLGAKEGLALNNGVQVSAAILLLALLDAERLVRLADLAVAMTVEAVRGTPDAFLPEVHRLRPFVGQRLSAAAILRFLSGSAAAGSDPTRIQDGYSIRCAPQVHGAARDSLSRVRERLQVEVNSATDNPLVIPVAGGRTISAGQFHGEPLALAAEALKIAISEVAAISERRTFRLLTKALSFGLPPLLAPPDRPGLGMMAVQFTAAALASECKHVAHPAAVDSIPTCEDQEDHVSMSPIAARGARRIVDNAGYVLAAEMLCAARALSFRREQDGVAVGEGARRCLEIIQPVLELDKRGAPPTILLERLHDLIEAKAFAEVIGEEA